MLAKLSNKVVSDISFFVIRLILGVIFIAHGYPKLFVWGYTACPNFLVGLEFHSPDFLL